MDEQTTGEKQASAERGPIKGLEIRVASEKDSSEWDKTVEGSPHGTLYHKWDWLKIAEKHSKFKVLGKKTGCELYPLMAYDCDELVAILPLFRYKRSGYEIVVSPPLKVDVHYLGPVIKGYDSFKQSRKESIYTNLVKSVDDFISMNFKPLYTTITSSPGLFDSRPFSWHGYDIIPKFTYDLSLSPDLKAINEGFSKDVRRCINHAQSAGVEVTVGDVGVESLYDLLFARHDPRGRNQMGQKEYYLDVCEKFSNSNLKTFLAYKDGNIISGLIVFHFKDKAHMWFGTPKPEVDGANEFLMWELIKWSKANGFTTIENIGADYRHLCRFKSKFNPCLIPHFTAKKSNSKPYAKLIALKRLIS